MAGKIRTIVKKTFTGAVAMADSAAPPGAAINPSGKDIAWELIGVTIKYSGDPGVESLTITYNAASGSIYDVVLKTQAMSGVTSFWWSPDNKFYVGPDDTIDFAQANGNSVTYGLEVTWGEAVA